MISLKSLVKYVREAKITAPKKGVQTPLDAKVQIPGFGVMTRKQMQGSIQRYISEISKYVKKGDAQSAYNAMFKRKVLKGFLETEIKHSGK
jgi:ribosomal protein S3AE|tara:strand:- start:51 stop:323 length:273 start_codon:yes stop_codon:yes gene_type:complete